MFLSEHSRCRGFDMDKKVKEYRKAIIAILDSVYFEDRGMGRGSFRIHDQAKLDKALRQAGQLIMEK